MQSVPPDRLPRLLDLSSRAEVTPASVTADPGMPSARTRGPRRTVYPNNPPHTRGRAQHSWAAELVCAVQVKCRCHLPRVRLRTHPLFYDSVVQFTRSTHTQRPKYA